MTIYDNVLHCCKSCSDTVQYLSVDALPESGRNAFDLSAPDQALCAQRFLRARFMRWNWSGVLCPDPEGLQPDRTEPSRRTFPVVLKYHLTEDGCNPQILITQPECKLNMAWNMVNCWRDRHSSEDLWALDISRLMLEWYTDIHRLRSALQCDTLCCCCLHLPTCPISKGANFRLRAAQGDHCGSWEGFFESNALLDLVGFAASSHVFWLAA